MHALNPVRYFQCRYSRWALLMLSSWLISVTALQAADKKLPIFVSVLPQKYFVEQVGGEYVDVTVMVQPGYSPATYEPTPRQISKLAKADVYIRIGVPFENAWMKRIQGVNPRMTLLDARDGIALRTLEAHTHADENNADKPAIRALVRPATPAHPHINTNQHGTSIQTFQPLTSMDPHIWSSPRLAKHMAQQVYELLAERLPEREAVFKQNLTHLQQALTELDQEISALLENSATEKFMVFHPSWGYFADAYQLTQVPIELDGKEPGAKALAELIRQARKEQIKTIFVQPQFDQRAAKQVAKAIGGQVAVIDPLAENYLETMRKAARLIAGVTDE